MENYSNPKAVVTSTPEKHVTKVISGEAKLRKRNAFDKMVDAFIAEDIKNVKEHIVADVVVPRVKQMLVDTINNAVNMIFFGTSARPSSTGFLGSTFSYGTNVNYRGISTGTISNNYSTSIARKDIPTYDEIVVPTRQDAERVLDELNDMISRFGAATINDLYEAVGIVGESTYCNYGWKSLRGADIGAVSNGFLLKMPKAILLK